MKRQARPFVVETKRSRKAPANMWASTPLLREELAAVSVAETKADAIFADKTAKEPLRSAEPQRRILPSLIVEPPPAPVEIEDTAPRRRIARVETELEERPKRGRPRRIADEGAEAPAFAAPRPAARKSATREAQPGHAERKPAAARKPEAVVGAPRPAPAAVGLAAPASAPERPPARPRTARAETAALPPGQRWKRRLPQLLW